MTDIEVQEFVTRFAAAWAARTLSGARSFTMSVSSPAAIS
jgi:hypothetical protein